MLLKRTRRTAESVTNERISSRAYDLWQSRGCPESDGNDDWQTAKEQLQAEAQLSVQQKPLRRLLARLRNRVRTSR